MALQITKTKRNDDKYRSIKELFSPGVGWQTKAVVVHDIVNKLYEYYTVKSDGTPVPVKVVYRLGEAYVESKPDGDVSDNLYSLPVEA